MKVYCERYHTLHGCWAIKKITKKSQFEMTGTKQSPLSSYSKNFNQRIRLVCDLPKERNWLWMKKHHFYIWCTSPFKTFIIGSHLRIRPMHRRPMRFINSAPIRKTSENCATVQTYMAECDDSTGVTKPSLTMGSVPWMVFRRWRNERESRASERMTLRER